MQMAAFADFFVTLKFTGFNWGRGGEDWTELKTSHKQRITYK